MKKKEIKELRQKTAVELTKLMKKIRQELVRFQVDSGAGKLKNINQIKGKKRDLARVMTILKEKELLGTSENKATPKG